MSDHDITHKEIYDRLLAVESKVDCIERNTRDVIAAFNAASGAFTVLEFIGKLAKPLLWIGAGVTAVVALWDQMKVR